MNSAYKKFKLQTISSLFNLDETQYNELYPWMLR